MNLQKRILLYVAMLLSVSVFSQQPAEVKSDFEAESGDFYASNSIHGVVLKAPDESCYRVRVENGGTLMTESVPCPGEQETLPVCGNDIREPGEACDDGNLVSGDGCSNICTNELAIIDTADVKWGFWGEDRNAFSGGGFTPDPDEGVETLFENYSFAHTKGMNLDWVNGDTNSRSYVANVLNAATITNTTLDLQLGSSAEYGWNFTTGRGNFNVDKWKDMISKFGHVNRPSFLDGSTIVGDPTAHDAIVDAINNGTITYIFLIDEPNHKRWSPQWDGTTGSNAPGNVNYVTNVMLDEMAEWVKTVFSDANVPIQTIVRTSAMNLAVSRGGAFNFQHMTHAYFTISSTKWVSSNPGNNKGLEWWMTEKDNFFNTTELAMYHQQGLKMSLMVQAGFESKGNPWTSVKNFADTWWQGNILYPFNGVTSYIKTAPGEMDFWIKSLLSPRDPTTGILNPNGQRLINEFVIFRADRLPTDSGKLPWTTRQHYRDFLNQLRDDINTENLVPIVGIPVGWQGN